MKTMHSTAASLVLVLACICASAQDVESPLGLADFAYTMTIEPGKDSPIQTLLIPPSVYKALVRADLGDLRVFAADGSQVSHALQRLDKDRAVTGKSLDLKLFPLTGSKAGSPGDDLQIVVKRSDNGKVVSVSTQDNAPDDPAERRVVGIVADASGLEQPIETLRFKLAPTDKSFELPIRIDTSSDLSSWSTTRRRALSHLKNEDKLLEQLDVSVGGIREPYLRITWGDEAPPTAITGIEAVLQDTRVPADLEGLDFEGTVDPENPRQVLFDLGSKAVPVDRATVIVPEKNVLFGGSLATSDLPDDAFRTVHSGTFFQLVNEGEVERNATVKLRRRTNQRYWRLEADEKGAGFGTSIPGLRIEYFPDQLIFLAKGSGPYTLAYGSSRAEPSSFTTREIFADFPAALRDDLPLSSARLGPVVESGGETARIPPPPLPQSKLPAILLWTILILGVVVLIYFVWKLSADIRKPADSEW